MDLIKYKMDLIWRRGDLKYVSIVAYDCRIESIPVPKDIRYTFTSIKRWLNSKEGQEAINNRL